MTNQHDVQLEQHINLARKYTARTKIKTTGTAKK